jgi:DNA helicase INO80
MDDEELAESVAKRKQAESHGYIAPIINPVKSKGLGELPLAGGDEDEDDFFSLKKKVVNGEDEDEVVPASGAGAAGGAAGGGGEGGKKGKSKRKAEGDRTFSFHPEGDSGADEVAVKRSHKKKSKAGLGADGLPL